MSTVYFRVKGVFIYCVFVCLTAMKCKHVKGGTGIIPHSQGCTLHSVSNSTRGGKVLQRFLCDSLFHGFLQCHPETLVVTLIDQVQIFTEACINQTLSIWLGTQLTQPTPELGPLQGEF